MKIIIVFPRRFFTKEQLSKLSKYDLEFVEGNDIDLEDVGSLYESRELIFALNPAYLKEQWNALPVERIKRMKGLKALCLTTTSFSWVDVGELKKLGIIVTNAPDKATNAVAEFNIFMMMSLLRKIPLIVKNDWKMDYDKFLTSEAKGLTAGIIGLGNIGSRVAELCKNLGMNVVYWNRSPKKVEYKRLELTELFKLSDVVFNTMATPPEVKGLVTDEMIKSMKKTAVIVDTSQPIYDQELVLKQVAAGKLGGLAFESLEKKLTDFEGNIMVFPEQAYYTLGTQLNTARIATESILSVIEGKPVNRVN
jgi:lactate dehydrogenase-like 2-hydroxyacid dehydrogenase